MVVGTRKGMSIVCIGVWGPTGGTVRVVSLDCLSCHYL